MESSLLPLGLATPATPAAGYIGGKRRLKRRLAHLIDAVPHTTYAEVFIGMASVFLQRTRQSKVEIINDISADVVTLFRVLREHGPEFVAYLQRWWVSSREDFERLRSLDPARLILTDFNRAARFLYLQRLAFGGKVMGRTFGIAPGETAAFDPGKLESVLTSLHRRLAPVTIERSSFGDFIARYDRDGTLFYLDPPYYECEADYGDGVFERADFQRMADQLAGLTGKFILSLNAHPAVSAIFARFTIVEVPTRYSVGGGDQTQEVTEVVISNLDRSLVASHLGAAE